MHEFRGPRVARLSSGLVVAAVLVAGRAGVVPGASGGPGPVADRPLEGTAWQLAGIVGGDATGSIPAGIGATLTFGDGRVSVQVVACNQGSGHVVVDESTIEVGALAMTRRACAPPPAEVEAAVAGVLNGRIGYRIEADTLTLTHPSGRGLVLRAPPR